MRAKHAGEVLAALKDCQRRKPIQGGAPKRSPIEPGVHQRDITRQAIDGFSIQQVAQRAALLDRAGSCGNTQSV
jgi:hypothetical protein